MCALRAVTDTPVRCYLKKYRERGYEWLCHSHHAAQWGRLYPEFQAAGAEVLVIWDCGPMPQLDQPALVLRSSILCSLRSTGIRGDGDAGMRSNRMSLSEERSTILLCWHNGR